MAYFDDPMLVADKNGIILYINKQLENLLEYTLEDVVNNHVNIYVPNYKHSTHKEQILNFNKTEFKSGIIGSGKYASVLGSLTVKWVKKTLGENEFPIGSKITIKYFEIDKKSKKPRSPIFLRKFTR